jgi:hypothetical protein
MENVLDLLAKPLNPREPVLALDERPVQLLDSAREGRAAAPGRLARRDYEYVRRGTANIFCVIEMLAGRHFTHATKNRKRARFAWAMKRIADAYTDADRIHVIMDNLNTHAEKSLVETFGERAGKRIWRRFRVHYTPKHASWLNPAETAVSMWSRECLGRSRIGTLAELKTRTTRWNADANRRKRKIVWAFETADARRVFGYKRGTTSVSRH